MVEHVADIEALKVLALRGLPQMLDYQKKTFCHSLVLTADGMVKTGLSRTNTLITLIGLRAAELAGAHSTIDVSGLRRKCRQDFERIDRAGDFGLYLWLSSLDCPTFIEAKCSALVLHDLLDRTPDARQGRTMELAWLLSGLSHCMIAGVRSIPLINFATEVYERLQQNQGPHGIFRHSALYQSISGIVRSRIGTFADQIYPIYAMATFFQAIGKKESADNATRCARVLCRLQGNQGQWWWHYDSTTGHVSGQYPVFSVHQDSMAPMAMSALEQATGVSYRAPVETGLQWTFGHNELGVDMRDESQSVIWRSIHPGKPRRFVDEAATFFGVATADRGLRHLKVQCECRPYHLGWILYAFRDPKNTPQFGLSEVSG
jgi:hypothetical protein